MSWGEKDGRIYGRKQGPAWPGPQTSLVPAPVPASGVGGPDGWCFAWLSSLAWALSEQHALLRAVSAWASTSCPFQEERNTRWVGRRRGAAQPLSELGHPGRGRPRGPAHLLPLRPGFSSPAPASRDCSVVPPPQPRSPGTRGSRGRQDVRRLPGGVGARPPPLPGDSGVQLLTWADPATRPWRAQPCPGLLVPSQPCTPEPCLGAHTALIVTSGQRHRGLPPCSQGPLAAGGGAATPFSPLPQPWLPGWGSLLGLALRASPLLSDLLTCPLLAQTSTMPAGPQPPCPGPSLQPPTPLVLRPQVPLPPTPHPSVWSF